MAPSRAPAKKDCDTRTRKVSTPPPSTANQCGHSGMILASPPDSETTEPITSDGSSMGGLRPSHGKFWEERHSRAEKDSILRSAGTARGKASSGLTSDRLRREPFHAT